jgi:hypothetical protein
VSDVLTKEQAAVLWVNTLRDIGDGNPRYVGLVRLALDSVEALRAQLQTRTEERDALLLSRILKGESHE